MRFFGRLLKYLLRSVFSIIIFLLLVGLAKMKWDINGYITFLDANDRSLFHRSQPATWADPFWPHKSVDAGIDEELSDEEIEAEMSGLNVYDPTFEEDLNVLPDNATTAEEDFGFTTESTKATGSTSTLRDLIKQHELP